MFNDDADASREIAKQGRKNLKLLELYESIKLEILDQSKVGDNKAYYKVPSEFHADVGVIVEKLEGEGYLVVLKEESGKSVLKISWEE
ncbi:hypothetical protein [Xanthomonas arboricola]|uniref:hypothetical protein n=1 Tax=Xanthomonas arboricola TaxID=56448 RepID=UPI0012DB48CC|nr:hypothetical protein [Xanthomonas arboricola]